MSRSESLRPLLLMLAAPLLLAPVAHASIDAQQSPTPADLVLSPQLGTMPLGPAGWAIECAVITAEAEVEDGSATTRLSMPLVNAGSEALAQVLVVLPTLPAGTPSVSLHVDQVEVARWQPEVVPSEEAVEGLLSLASGVGDPRPLEFVGRPCLHLTDLRLPPGASEVRVEYEHELPELSADSTRSARAFELVRSQAPGSLQLPWTFDLTLRATEGLADHFCPTHRLALEESSATHRRLVSEHGRHPEPGSLVLFPMPEREHWSTLLLAWPDPDRAGGLFALVAAPSSAQREAARERPRELTFVLDVSGSMAGEKLDQAREAARQVLEDLREQEHFNLIRYATEVESLFDRPSPATPENVAAARAFLEETRGKGSTFISGALQRALGQPRAESGLPLVLFLTDGRPTHGITDERPLVHDAGANNAQARRLFTFGVGHDVNAPLLDALARQAGGVSHYVAPDEDIEVEVERVHSSLRGPLLLTPRLSALDEHDRELAASVLEAVPRRPRDLFAEDKLLLFGRYEGQAPLRISVAGDDGVGPTDFEARLEPGAASAGNDFIPGLWAARRTAELIGELREGGAGGAAPERLEALARSLLRLAQRHGVMSEYTAFLALPDADLLGPEETLVRLRQLIEDRALRARVGRAAVTQSINEAALRDRSVLERTGHFLSEDGNSVTLAGVVGVDDRAYFARHGVWVDSTLLVDGARRVVDEEVWFGTARHRELTHALARRGAAAALALPGAVLLPDGGRNVLLRQP
jgi:uncharacterized protein YegL